MGERISPVVHGGHVMEVESETCAARGNKGEVYFPVCAFQTPSLCHTISVWTFRIVCWFGNATEAQKNTVGEQK